MQQKEKNAKSPLIAMKNVVSRLKQQLHEKEVQQQVGSDWLLLNYFPSMNNVDFA